MPAFALAIQHAKRTGSAQLRDKVRNVAKILGDRNVYSKKFVINLLTNIERPSATDGDSSSEPPTAALPTSPTTEFVPNNLSSTQNSIKLSSSVLGLKRSSSPTATSPRVGGAPPKKARLKESTAFSIDMGSSLATTTLSSPNGASATSLATTMTAHATAETLFNGSMQEVRTADPRIFKDDGSLEGLYGDELVDQHAACVDVLAHLQLVSGQKGGEEGASDESEERVGIAVVRVNKGGAPNTGPKTTGEQTHCEHHLCGSLEFTPMPPSFTHVCGLIHTICVASRLLCALCALCSYCMRAISVAHTARVLAHSAGRGRDRPEDQNHRSALLHFPLAPGRHQERLERADAHSDHDRDAQVRRLRAEGAEGCPVLAACYGGHAKNEGG